MLDVYDEEHEDEEGLEEEEDHFEEVVPKVEVQVKKTAEPGSCGSCGGNKKCGSSCKHSQ